MARINCDTVITSSSADTSGLCFGNFDATTPITASSTPVGVSPAGCLVTIDAITGQDLFSVTDGVTTEVIQGGDTLTYAAGNGMAIAVSATDTVTYSADLSADAGNELQFGTDGGLFHDETVTSMVQNDTTGVITFTDEDGGTSTADVVSADAGNNISVGSDGGAFFDAPPVVDGGSYDDATNTLNLNLNTDGVNSTVAIPLTDLIGVWLADFTISDGVATDVVNNHDTVEFLGTGGITTAITGNTVTTGLCLSTDANNGLSIGTDGCLFSNGAFSITDGATTETIDGGDTITFVGGDQITAVVSGTDTVTFSYDNYQATTTLAANGATVINHALNVEYPHVTAYDPLTGEKVELCVDYTDPNNITVTSTVAGDYAIRVSA